MIIGLTKSQEIEVDKLVHMAHFKVEYSVKGDPFFLSSEKELIVFRIVQESFNNIVKHAKATTVWLQLSYCDHYLNILIKDNGIGFIRDDSKLASKAGLLNRKTWVKSFGGQLVLESLPEKGTQILITGPYN